MRPYVIRQGDHLTKLAHQMGFNAATVWDDPRNEKLKALRSTGDILYPGDILYVPDPQDGAGRLLVFPGVKNKYTAKIPTVPIRIVLKDEKGALAGKPFTVHGMGKPHRGTTGGDGAAAFEVPVHIRDVELHMDGTEDVYPIMIGDMNPIEEPSGVWKRLEHLGHLSALDVGPGGPSPAALRLAFSAFQTSVGLPDTGALDDATRAALLQRHGS